MREPICIFRPGKKSEDWAQFQDLLPEDVQNHKVVVVSIAGRYRQGKSFLMNFMIKYLRAAGAENWLENDSQNRIEGFQWKHTRKRVTMGVLIWPEIFKVRNASGEEVVVLLMDTQGVFDTETSIKEGTSIFSLSVLLSSMQIFNIKQNIQGDDLSHLELFTEFGRLISSKNPDASAESGQKPFQDLIFLVRDWAYPEENAYGWEGGNEVLQEELNKCHQEGELASMRASIQNCFDSTTGFLMPFPGETVNASSKFKGDLADMKPEFVQYLKTFVTDLLCPSRLRTKRVNGKELTVRDFCTFVSLYVEELHSNKLPTPETLYDATVKATNEAVVNSCFQMYQTRMAELIMNDPKEPAAFDTLHDTVLTEMFTHFNNSMKMGGDEAIKTALTQLNTQIANLSKHFRAANSSAYDRKRYDEKIQQLLEAQKALTDQVKSLGDSTGKLQQEIAAAKEAEKRLKEQAAQAAQNFENEMKKARSRKCSIL